MHNIDYLNKNVVPKSTFQKADIFQNGISKGDSVIPQPDLLQLSAGNMDRHGAYLMDCSSYMYLWLGASVSDKFCQEVFDVPTFQAVPQDLVSIYGILP